MTHGYAAVRYTGWAKMYRLIGMIQAAKGLRGSATAFWVCRILRWVVCYTLTAAEKGER
jgi:hypothetical protein